MKHGLVFELALRPKLNSKSSHKSVGAEPRNCRSLAMVLPSADPSRSQWNAKPSFKHEAFVTRGPRSRVGEPRQRWASPLPWAYGVQTNMLSNEGGLKTAVMPPTW